MNKRETLIGRLHGSLAGWRETVDEIFKEEFFDENGVLDSEYAIQILKSVNEAMEFAEFATKTLLLKMGGAVPEVTKKKDDLGAKWTVEEILKHCTLRDNVLYLPNVRLNKKAYQEAKVWIEEAGGNWSTKQKGFTFDFNAD